MSIHDTMPMRSRTTCRGNSRQANRMVQSNISSSGGGQFHAIENFIVIWLDSKANEANNDTQHTIKCLQRMVNTIRKFSNPDECVNYLTEIENEKVFVIVSGRLGDNLIPLISEMSQLAAIYIFCQNESRYKHWIEEWKKVKG